MFDQEIAELAGISSRRAHMRLLQARRAWQVAAMSDQAANLVAPSPAKLEEAAACLRAGGLVAFPTETVYGLGADATNDMGVARIFEAKGRPQFNPLISHMHDVAMAQDFGVFSDLAMTLAGMFWPGPLTLVVPRTPSCTTSLLASAGLDTLAVRVPHHEVAQTLIKHVGRPLAAPSANPSGGVSPTTAAHVSDGLAGKVDMIVDGGPCTIGLESTVVAVAGDQATLLRPGSITRAQLEAVCGVVRSPQNTKIQSPGMLASHYAPGSPVRLNATDVGDDEALLAFGALPSPPSGPMLNLSPAGDLVEAAANLFAMLRKLDGAAAGGIAVMPIPAEGIGEAINDRLNRAAAPKEL